MPLFNVRLTVDELADLKAIAVAQRTTNTGLIRQWIRRAKPQTGLRKHRPNPIPNEEGFNTSTLNSQPSNKPKKNLSSSAILLAELLAVHIRQNNPKAKLPSRLDAWALEADLMMRCDGRTEQEIREVLAWSQADSFWRANILSMAKLRKQFDALVLRKAEPANNLRGYQRKTSGGLFDGKRGDAASGGIAPAAGRSDARSNPFANVRVVRTDE